jgi:hypothetical protein
MTLGNMTTHIIFGTFFALLGAYNAFRVSHPTKTKVAGLVLIVIGGVLFIAGI